MVQAPQRLAEQESTGFDLMSVEETLRRRNRELELLHQAAEAFGSSLDLDEVLRTVLDQTCDLLGVIAGSIWLIDRDQVAHDREPGNLVCLQAVGPKSDLLRGWRLPAGKGIVGWVADNGESLMVPDARANERHFDGVDQQLDLGIRSILGVPLRMKQKVIGVLQVVDTHVGRFHMADLGVLEPLATSAAIAIENARLYKRAQLEIAERARVEDELRLRNRELALLNQVISASALELDTRVILEAACRELARAFEVPHTAATLLNPEKSAAVVMAEYLIDDQSPTLNDTIPVKDNPVFQYLLTKKAPLVVTDARGEPWHRSVSSLMCQQDIASLLTLPLMIEGEVVGSLGLGTKEARRFSALEVSLAWSVADQVSGVLARAKLAQTHRRLSAALEQTADGVMITDKETTILYVNPAFERITGLSRAEVLGKTADIFQVRDYHPVGLLQAGSFYKEMWSIVDGGGVWQGRLASQKKDGASLTVDTTISPVYSETGAIISYVGLLRDVTREVQLEAQYRQAQKMEAVGRLTAGIAHDFNNLLTAINGFTELVQFRLPPDDPAQELVSKVRYSGQRAAGLVSQLLAFSRKQDLKPQVLDLNEVVGELDKMLRRVIGEDIELQTSLSPDLWPVKVDPAQIEQVVLNLAVNARDAMPGGGKLTIETANVVLDEDYVGYHLDAQPGEHVLLAVSDTGVGMSEEVKAHLFEPFFTTKEEGKGTGLGLATVYGIVKQSGGQIWVYSEPGQPAPAAPCPEGAAQVQASRPGGTTFKIYLPRCQETLQPRSQARGSQALPSGGETILLVEDDDQVREVARLVLERQGYLVLEAADGQQALQLAGDHSGPIHLLLTDVVMPGLSGQAVVETLTRTRPEVKILYISGYADEAIMHHGVLEPGVAMLQKPFSVLALARQVRAVLDGGGSLKH
jgi:PAS domain S-box-containing protein